MGPNKVDAFDNMCLRRILRIPYLKEALLFVLVCGYVC